MRLMSASLILLMDCPKGGAVVFIAAEPLVQVKLYAAEVPPRRLHDDAASRDTS